MQSSLCNGKKNAITRNLKFSWLSLLLQILPHPTFFALLFQKNFPQTLPPLSAPLKFIMLKFQFPFLHDILHFVVFCFAAVKISSKDILRFTED